MRGSGGPAGRLEAAKLRPSWPGLSRKSAVADFRPYERNPQTCGFRPSTWLGREHSSKRSADGAAWMPGTRPGMTVCGEPGPSHPSGSSNTSVAPMAALGGTTTTPAMASSTMRRAASERRSSGAPVVLKRTAASRRPSPPGAGTP